MSGSRRAWLDASPGERRGVITLDGRPERLWIERPDDPPELRLAARVAARVRRTEPSLRTAFLELGPDSPATCPLAPGLTEGAAVTVEVVAEPRRGKAAVVRVLGPAEGAAPRVLAPAPTLDARLAAAAPGVPTSGEAAREAADVAEEAALAVGHDLPGGGSVWIERTRALVAVDVDLGPGWGEAGRAARRVNLIALAEVARLLRLKALGGVAVIDLVGGGQDGDALLAAAKAAFAPDQPGVVFGPLSRLGLFQLARPWRDQPVEDRLLDEAGDPTARTRAVRLIRDLEREGRADPGGRFEALCDPAVAAEASLFAAELGPRFSVRPDLGRAPERPDVRRL